MVRRSVCQFCGEIDFAERFAVAVVDGGKGLEGGAVVESGACRGGVDFVLWRMLREGGLDVVDVEGVVRKAGVGADAG